MNIYSMLVFVFLGFAVCSSINVENEEKTKQVAMQNGYVWVCDNWKPCAWQKGTDGKH